MTQRAALLGLTWALVARSKHGQACLAQYGRIKLIDNNSRFLILPDWHQPNVGSRVLALMQRRVAVDWQARFGHPVLLLETFVDPSRFHGGVSRASNWTELGLTQVYRRTRTGYSAATQHAQMGLCLPLRACS